MSENGVTNQVSAWANSDSGPEYCRASLLGDTLTPEGVAMLWRQSPLRHVANVRTPLLMLQAEADLRCPPQDNEQFFVALRHLRRTVEYVLYPDESHVYAVTAAAPTAASTAWNACSPGSPPTSDSGCPPQPPPAHTVSPEAR